MPGAWLAEGGYDARLRNGCSRVGEVYGPAGRAGHVLDKLGVFFF